MTRCIGQEICNMSYMNLDKKTKLIDRCVEKDPSVWIAAALESRNVPVDDPQGITLFVNKPVAVGYKKSLYDNLKLENVS